MSIKHRIFFFLFITISSVIQAQITWNTPVTISTLGVDASNTRIGMDASGNCVAIWIESGLLKAKTLPVGGSWSAATTLSGSGASSGRLLVAPSGTATALWIEGGLVKASTKPFGGAWGSVSTLSAILGGAATQLACNIDTSGNIVAVWVQPNVLSTIILLSSTKLAAGSWQALADTISGSTNTPSSPSVSIGTNGAVVCVWHSVSGSNDLINSNSKTLSGGVWGTPTSLFSASDPLRHNYPKVTVDASGNAYAMWFRYLQSGNTYSNVVPVVAQLSTGNTAWSTLNPLSLPSLQNPALLPTHLRIDNSGNAIAMWISTYDGMNYNLETASALSNGYWQSQGAYTVDLYTFGCDLNVLSQSDVVAAFMFYDSSSSMIQYFQSNIANPNFLSWTFPQTISQGTNNGYPYLASTIVGTTINSTAVWLQNNGSNTIMKAATGTGSIVLPASGLSVSQSSTSFGIFTDYYNTLSWSASSDPNLAGYYLYRNGSYFAAVDPSTLTFVDHNAAQSGVISVTYSVIAYNTDGRLSNAITFTLP